MRKEIITSLSTLKENMAKINTFLYENPENSYEEKLSSKFLMQVLKENNFSVEKTFLHIPNSFYASIGEGHPKICIICEYDADPIMGHISGNNIKSSIALCSAIVVSKILTHGSLFVIGCPGGMIGSSEEIMIKQGAFEDMDAAFMVQPYVKTLESSPSLALMPISINGDIPNEGDLCFKYYNLISTYLYVLKENFDFEISSIGLKLENNSMNINFNILSPCINSIKSAEKNFISFINSLNETKGINLKIELSKIPNCEMNPNKTLSRLFSHNLKESGIIDILPAKNINRSFPFGCISNTVPFICPYIGITSDPEIKYNTKEFSNATQTEFALGTAFKVATALCETIMDLYEKDSLINEAKAQLLEK